MEQLNLRLAEIEDAEKLLLLEEKNQDKNFAINMTTRKLPREITLELIENKIRRVSDIKGVYVIETANKDIIASCSFDFTFHRNGYTFLNFNTLSENTDTLNVEALNMIVNFCFQNLNFNKLNVYVRSSRIRDMDTFFKCGFSVEVCSRQRLFINGNYEDIYHLGITKYDYLNKTITVNDINEFLKKECFNIDKDYMIKTNVPPNKKLLIGEKVDLTLITSEDAEKIYELSLNSDDKNYASIGAAAPISLNSILEGSKNENDLYFLKERISFGIKKKDGEIIGTIDADTIDHRNRNLMIGISIYDIGERGKGYGREAIELFTDFVFLEMNMHRVYLGGFAFNRNSINLYERIGFKLEGVNRSFVYRNGNYYDEYVLGVLRQEWFTLRKYIV